MPGTLITARAASQVPIQCGSSGLPRRPCGCGPETSAATSMWSYSSWRTRRWLVLQPQLVIM